MAKGKLPPYQVVAYFIMSLTITMFMPRQRVECGMKKQGIMIVRW